MPETCADSLGKESISFPIEVGDKIPSAGVYFLAACGYVKIGYSADVAVRYRTISSVLPVEPRIIAFIEAPRDFETNIHRELRDIHLKNEWYPDCERVRDLIARSCEKQFEKTVLVKNTGAVKPINPQVLWAGEQLKKLADPHRNEPIRVVIERAASRAGMTYGRAFEIWYGRARQLLAHERISIAQAMEAANV